MGQVSSLAAVCVLWAIAQFALNAVDVTTTAFIPDRYPRNRRGRASAVLGAGALVGGASGTVLAGSASDQLSLAYTTLGGCVVAATVLFAVVVKDPPTGYVRGRGVRRPPLADRWSLGRTGSSDFRWAFVSRFLFTLGYSLVSVLQLYILSDYIGVPEGEADSLVGTTTAITFGTTLLSAGLVGPWSDRSGGRRNFLVAASLILIAALATPLQMPTVTGVILASAIEGVGFGIYLACGTALVVDVLPRADLPGQTLGIYNVATNIPQALAPSAAAMIVAMSGEYRALYVSAIVGVALSTLALVRVRTGR
jgi:MFS family permease